MTGGRLRNVAVVGALCVVLCVMVTAVSYSVTLYRLFCEATGFGGATQRVASDNAIMSNRVVTIRFNADVAPGMPWRFAPVQPEVKVHLGEEKLVYFTAQNLSDKPIVGHATYNVTPTKSGAYFNKIQCFCFTEERLEAGKTVEMPVDFYVDPALAKDPSANDVDTITLSYTFFPSVSPDKAEDLSRFDPHPPDPGHGREVFATRCIACHDLARNKLGPELGNVVGRDAASVAGFNYSSALRAAHVTWTAETLDKWLADPQRMVPGTRMPLHLTEPQDRADVIAYLQQQAKARSGAAATTAAGAPKS